MTWKCTTPLRLGVLCVATLAAPATSAAAQQESPRSGVWVGAGIGGGWARVQCNICTNDHEFALSGYIRLGSTLTPQVAIGLEAAGWRKREEAVTGLLGTAGAALYWYPTTRRNAYYLKAGLGVIAYELDDNPAQGEEDEAPITSRSFAGQLGVGYELRLTDKISFNPFVNVFGSLYANLSTDGTRIADAGLTLIQFGAGVIWH